MRARSFGILLGCLPAALAFIALGRATPDSLLPNPLPTPNTFSLHLARTGPAPAPRTPYAPPPPAPSFAEEPKAPEPPPMPEPALLGFAADTPDTEPADSDLQEPSPLNAPDILDSEPAPEPPSPIAEETWANDNADPSPPSEIQEQGEQLASIAKETWVFAEPRWGAKKLGYLRAGAKVKRNEKAAGFKGCAEGWFRIEPKGYVCVGSQASLDVHHPVAEAASKQPITKPLGLPYLYAMSRLPPPVRYTRLPTQAEQRRAEPDLASHLRKSARLAHEPGFVEAPLDPTPNALLYDRPAPALGGTFRAPDTLVLGSAKPRSAFALLASFDHENRLFGLTTELELIPLDRTRIVRQSSFAGISLTEGLSLPVAFTRSRRALRYIEGPANSLVPGEAIPYRSGFALASENGSPISKSSGATTFLRTREGFWIRADQSVVIPRPQHPPAFARKGRKWIDVSILHQTLVAYEGLEPVYATLVSTGADGLGDPKKTHSTIQGTFLIHTKHKSVTMDGEDGLEFDFRDVPFVQYFTEGFALHAAYWHDEFGTPRSHGCVNLSPIDAAWLFQWTTPTVPEHWHAALSLRGGTIVHTHP